MAVLTPDEIKILKDSGNEGLAAIALKLESTNLIPQDRFNEVLKRAKDAEDAHTALVTQREKEDAEKMAKQGEYKTLAEKAKAENEQLQKKLEEESALANQTRELKAAKVAKLKDDMGEDFLPEYESFSLASLEKLSVKKAPAPGTETTPPGGVPITKNNPFAKGSINLTKQVELKKTNPALYEKLKSQAH